MAVRIAICSGHTSCSGAVVENGRVVGAAPGEPINPHVLGGESIGERLGRLLADLAAQSGRATAAHLKQECEMLALALPGAIASSDMSPVRDGLRLAGCRNVGEVRVLDDTWAGLAAGTLSLRGICAFAGTGASVFIGRGDVHERGDRPNKIDGWGPVLGDLGSAFQLGQRGLQRICRDLDREARSPLTERFMAEHESKGVGVQTWFDDLVKHNVTEWRTEIALVARYVTELAEANLPDPSATSLVRGVAKEMVDTIEVALSRHRGDRVPIVLQGGMFEHSKIYRERVRRSIRARFGNEIFLAKLRPVVGTMFLTAPHERWILDIAAMNVLIDSIRQLSPLERGLLTRPRGKILRRDSRVGTVA